MIQTFVDGLGVKDPDLAISYRVVLEKLGDQAVPYLIQRYMDNNPQTRRNIIRLLGSIKMKPNQKVKAFATLIQALGDSSLLVRMESERALIALGDSLEPVLCDSSKDKNEQIRKGVLRVLFRLKKKTSRMISCFIEALGDDSYSVVEEGVYNLKELGVRILPDLTKALGDSENWKIRRGLARVLGKLGKDAAPAVEALLRASTSDANLRVRFEAKWALKKLEKVGAYTPKKEPEKKEPEKKEPEKKEPEKKEGGSE